MLKVPDIGVVLASAGTADRILDLPLCDCQVRFRVLSPLVVDEASVVGSSIWFPTLCRSKMHQLSLENTRTKRSSLDEDPSSVSDSLLTFLSEG